MGLKAHSVLSETGEHDKLSFSLVVVNNGSSYMKCLVKWHYSLTQRQWLIKKKIKKNKEILFHISLVTQIINCWPEC